MGRLHALLLRQTQEEGFGHRLHHRDVLGVALRRLQQDLGDNRKAEVIQDLSKELRKDR